MPAAMPAHSTRGAPRSGKAPAPATARSNGSTSRGCNSAPAIAAAFSSSDFADETRGDVELFGTHPANPRGWRERLRLAPERRAELRQSLRDGGIDLDRDEQSHGRGDAWSGAAASSIRRTMSSAACDAWNFTSSRSPTNRNTRERDRSGPTAATATVPTGFSARPASGPRDARDADANVYAGVRADALRHRQRDRLAHGSVFVDKRRRNAEQRNLGVVRVCDHRALHVARAARDVRQTRCQQPAGARLGAGNAQPALHQQIADNVFETAPLEAVGVETQDHADLPDRGVHGGGGAVARLRARGKMQLDLSERRENRRLDRHGVPAPTPGTAAAPLLRCAIRCGR